jgi:FkbM family methyltransferase
MFNKIIKRIANFIFKNIFKNYSIKSYSQEGEDMILKRYYENYKNGFYVDIGAHHPTRFSNTKLLYQNGWNGINVDAMPGSMKLFNRFRKRDINIELGISEKPGFLNYYIFNESALNGFSEDLSNYRNNQNDIYKIKEIKKINIITLEMLFDKYLPPNQIIDLLSIDVEGLDLEVLKSNNWIKYKPNLILVEILSSDLIDSLKSPISLYLIELGYMIYFKTVNTVFFKKLIN